MQFSDEEIEYCRRFKKLGLDWTPTVGNYVYDETGVCKPSSPFQAKVYFILNYECFMNVVGSVERFREVMTWLLTWEDCRAVLKQLGHTDSQVSEQLSDVKAIEQGSERLALYKLIEKSLDAAVCAAD